MKYKVLSCFAGIGGIDLGLERTGHFETVAFCEIDAKARAVLAKHWNGVKQYDDIRALTGERLRADGIVPDFVAGGFPCQDISAAGKGAGLGGERSGLFFELARLVGEIRPRGVLLENVAMLRSRGLDVVLGTLAALGYDAEWHCLPASAVGAPHQRDRIWILCHPHDQGEPASPINDEASGLQAPRYVADPNGDARHERRAGYAEQGAGGRDADRGFVRADLPDASRAGLQGHAGDGEDAAGRPDAHGPIGSLCLRQGADAARWWAVEPPVGRVANGVPGRVDRLKQLGNAVVPQIPELLGRAFAERFPA